MPTPTIPDGELFFNATTYTGNGSAGRVITVPSINNVGFAWVKLRSGSDDHRLANTVTGGNRHLQSNTTAAESTGTNVIQAFSGNTFTVGSDNSVNVNGSTYVAWTWANGGAATTIAVGSVSPGVPSIASSVSANTTSGFSVVTYTGNGSAGVRIGHGLGVAPRMMIVKQRGSTTDWAVYHASLPSAFGIAGTQVINLNTTSANTQNFDVWDSNNPEATVFSVGASTLSNANGGTYVAYCWSQIAGYSAFGSYTGNGSTDGPFVYLGFRPRLVLVKESSSAGNNWVIYDTARDTFNECSKILYPNASNAEFDGSTVNLDILSNGFKPRDNWGGNNNSGSTYIYAAFAENPFKYANAR